MHMLCFVPFIVITLVAAGGFGITGWVEFSGPRRARRPSAQIFYLPARKTSLRSNRRARPQLRLVSNGG